MRLFFISFIICVSNYAKTPIKLSNKAEVSILTCAPGVNELYSYFGHSAIRIKDKQNDIDKVYNYGMFDFSAPNFYLNFCRGKLLYKVIGYEYKYFPYVYYKEKRTVKSQLLNLTQTENQKVYDFLEWNILPENKNYYYDFFYDNCSTKMYEVIEKSIGEINFDFSEFPKNLTHRDLICKYLPKNSWSKFGIDLALGSVIDKKATYKEYMFLPDFTHLGLKNSTLSSKPIIAKENYILQYSELKKAKTKIWISPLFISSLLLLCSIIAIFKFNNKYSSIYFNSLSIVYGIIGLILISLWFFTEHTTTQINLNVLWANPLLIVLPFTKEKYKTLLKKLGIISLISFIITAIIQVQIFNISFYILAFSILPFYFKNVILSIKK